MIRMNSNLRLLNRMFGSINYNIFLTATVVFELNNFELKLHLEKKETVNDTVHFEWTSRAKDIYERFSAYIFKK